MNSKCWLLALLVFAAPHFASAAPFELKKGDHVCLIGNVLPERMQHEGNLEARIYSRFPQEELVFRNLGFSGDELTQRLRSMDFGSPDEWLAGNGKHPGKAEKAVKDKSVLGGDNRFALTNTKADVIFAFFGYNESWDGEAGLGKFKGELEGTLKNMLGKQYNGKSAPRIVLFSPIAIEDLKNPLLPSGEETNKQIKLYTDAMAEVAKAQNVTFVDLYTPTLAAYATAKQPWTNNGLFLNAYGDAQLAAVIEKALFGDAPERSGAAYEKLRAAVNDKNFYWYYRYRTTDGYSVFGDRAFLTFTDGQSNYEVGQRELQQLDVKTSNRDKNVWAIAQGKDSKVDDSNIPPPLVVKTNKPGAGPNGTHIFLGAKDPAIEKMKLYKGLKVNLYASEDMFPDMTEPVQIAWDTKGRLWCAVWHSYPHWKPTEEMNDKLVILEDTNNDGVADKCITFADKLSNPTGFEFWNGGVLVAQAPDLVFLKDTNGDDKADVKERVLHGLDTADTHHTANSFTLDPGGALYFQEGTFHHSQVENPWGPPLRNVNAGVFRYEPRSQQVEMYTAYSFANPHGHVFDRWGQDIVTDGTGNANYLGTAFSGHTNYPQKHGGMQTIFKQRTRPCAATEILSSRHFPDELQGNFLNCNVIGVQAILNYKLTEDKSGIKGEELDPIIQSSDPNFRPTDVEIGPDGAIYFGDWQNPIIGHMQHNLRDPNRDRAHGRIYRITAEGRPLLTPAKIAGEPIEKLLDLLKDPENRTRYRVRIELSGRKSDEVVAAVKKWIATLDKNDPNYEHHLTEALWVHQHHNVVDEGLLQTVLTAKDYHARAAATRVLCYWRDELKDPLALLQKQVNDEQPRVRLEAIRALSFFAGDDAKKAQDILAEALLHPDDDYIKYTFKESNNTLENVIKGKKNPTNVGRIKNGPAKKK